MGITKQRPLLRRALVLGAREGLGLSRPLQRLPVSRRKLEQVGARVTQKIVERGLNGVAPGYQLR
jgi:hypothetical protein